MGGGGSHAPPPITDGSKKCPCQIELRDLTEKSVNFG